MATVIKKASPKPLPVQLTAQAKETPAGASEHVAATSVKASAKQVKSLKEYDEAGSSIESLEPVEVVVKQPVAHVSKKFKDGSETDEDINVGKPLKFKAPHASVSFSAAMTKNLGNYESIKFSVMLTVPCENTKEAQDEAFEESKVWVDAKINSILTEFEES